MHREGRLTTVSPASEVSWSNDATSAPNTRQLQPSHDLNELTEAALRNRQTRFRTVDSWSGIIHGHGTGCIRAGRRLDDNLQSRALKNLQSGNRCFELFLVLFPEGEEAWPGWPRYETCTRAWRRRSIATQADSEHANKNLVTRWDSRVGSCMRVAVSRRHERDHGVGRGRIHVSVEAIRDRRQT